MSVTKERLDYLFQRYVEKRCSDQEMRELFEYIKNDENRDLITRFMDGQFNIGVENIGPGEIDWEDIYQKAIQNNHNRVIKLFPWRRIVAAASVILIISFGVYRFNTNEPQLSVTNKKQSGQDIPPGTNKAVLTLGDGSTIFLDEAGNGVISSQGNTSIKKDGDGKVVYNVAAGPKASSVFNKITTPRGGQYQVILSDGTKVWLNATSSLRFPASFSGNERRVELTGEAYFEVVKNSRMPFKVTVVKGMDIEVLGTHFNIMAYPEEDEIRTTLAEGSVKVTNKAGTKMIKPGQEAISKGSTEKIQVGEADVEQALAWKNGLFHFENAELTAVMRQIERWYDVDVSYTGSVPAGHYRGKVSRYSNISSVLKILELSGINFTIQEGRKIIVKAR